MGLLLTTRRNDGRRTLLLNEDARAVRVHGVHVIFNTHRQIRTDESCVFTLVPLTLSSLLPSFLPSLRAVDRNALSPRDA